MDMHDAIQIENLQVTFHTPQGSVHAVKHLTTTFKPEQITGVIGESGSGKSVMGMSILGLLPLTAGVEGKCYYKGRNLYQLEEKELRKLRGVEIGLIPQNPTASLNPMMKISRQLKEASKYHKLAKEKVLSKRIYELLKDFGFVRPESVLNQYSFQMSGGMNQRIVSLLGLACEPRWIIADEPTKGLDAIVRKQVYRVLKQIYKKNKCSMIVITHDLKLAYHLCHEIRVMYKGEIVEQGPCKKVMENPRHPYTKGLLAAMPENGLKAIIKVDESVEENRSSCPFYNRCKEATSGCEYQYMQDFAVEADIKVRCFLYA